MNTGCSVCGSFCSVFLIFALIFALLKGKASLLISGFNTLSKEQKASYDKERMCRDHRNSFLIWSAIFGIGAILSHFISQYAAPVAFIVWSIIFFKDVHLDAEKAFRKYKLKNR